MWGFPENAPLLCRLIFSSKAVLISLHLVWFDHSVDLDILNRGHLGQKHLKYLPFVLYRESLWPLILNKILVSFPLLWQIPWPIAICGEETVSFPFHVSSLVTVHDWGKSGQQPGGRSCGRIPFTGVPFGLCLAIFSCTAQVYLLRDSGTHIELGPPTSFNNQQNAPQKRIQVNLI